MILRRTFLGWLAAIVALPRAARAARAARRGVEQLPSPEAIRALGAAILPSELGRARSEVASDAFLAWMKGYRDGAELLHPYGSPRISYAPVSPVPAWERQLAALDREARARHDGAFGTLSVRQRQQLVRAALAEFRDARLDDVAAAPHVALGLLAHFYSSSEATDLCYRARIGRNTCRPLMHNERKPLPLATP